MPSRRPRRSKPSGANPVVPEPTRDALTFRGKPPTPQMLIDLWREGDRALKNRTKRIERARSFRRGEPKSLVKVDKDWARLNPEAAALAQLKLPQRVTLERDLIARVGSAEPVYEREPLGFNESDVEGAEACAAYLNEWRLRSVPTETFAGKSVEDSEFARVTLPCDLDMDGCPDYYQYLDDAAYDDLDDDKKSAYARDRDVVPPDKVSDIRNRYVRVDANRERVARPEYQPEPLSADEERAIRSKYPEKLGEGEQGKIDTEKNDIKTKRHEDAVKKYQDAQTAYILRRGLDASANRVIPALDCRPIFKRGRGRDRWELVCLVERVLYESWELLENEIGWENLGDRLMTPRAARDDGTTTASTDVGTNGQFYLYTVYTVCKSTKDRRDHPCIFSCVGGAGTWDGRGGTTGDAQSVMIIDLYQTYKIESPLWSYHFGLHTEDDEPDFYGQPYLDCIIPLLSGMEAMEGAIRSTVALNAFTGYIETKDPNLPDEALLNADASLRVSEIPGAGQIKPAGGVVTPFRQASVGQDAWRSRDADHIALNEITAIDTVQGGSGVSGHRLLVEQTLGTIAKRQNRECVRSAAVACAEAHLRILMGIFETWGIRWPIRTTQERPVKGAPREAQAPAIFDPDWVKDGQFNVSADFPSEANLAMVDLEFNLMQGGGSSFDTLMKAKGEANPNTERKNILMDRIFNSPAGQMYAEADFAKKTGNKAMMQIIKGLQDQGEITKAALPGAPNGAPTSALNRGTGKPPVGASVRGGIEAAQMGGARLQQQAGAALANGTMNGAAA